jgi:PKD repeat protein
VRIVKYFSVIAVLLLFALCVQIGISCCPECGDDCSGQDSGDGSYYPTTYPTTSYIPTSVVSISNTVLTPSTSKPSGTSVDYHVNSKADKLEGYIPLKIHFWDESKATQGVTAIGWEWDLGDGTKETKKDFNHTYTSAGTFKVIPKVRWSDGAHPTNPSNI